MKEGYEHFAKGTYRKCPKETNAYETKCNEMK